MQLNIKNGEAHALAAQLAALTGESMAQAVTNALREQLNRVTPSENLAERLLAIGRDCAARIPEEYRNIDINELLYDENGLPK